MMPYHTNDNGSAGMTQPARADSPPIDSIPVNAQGNGSPHDSYHAVDTEFLIVGAGPAGAALACFLGSHGLQGIMISSASGTANTPRAHITNMAALECLRDIGLYDELGRLGSKGADHMQHTRWCHSIAGEEYARIYSWGNDPRRKGDYKLSSLCDPFDLPQTILEPVLVRHAASKGFKCRFDSALVSFTNDPNTGLITANIEDKLSHKDYQIRTRYLFGADGARSEVVKQLNLPLIVQPSQGAAINILVKADLSYLVKSRTGNLHWVMQPDREHPGFGWMGIVRMVKPWNKWMFILFPDPNRDRSQEFIGDDTRADILSISTWHINEIVAEKYSEGDIFCLGDAVHRHPPFNGLGSNTCIQDTFNLAWKIAYIHKGLASLSLLSTYSVERQPVSYSIITRANQAFRDQYLVWRALGMLPVDVTERIMIMDELKSATPEGVVRRRALHEAPKPYALSGRAAENSVLFHEPSTYPGSRLPHAWLNKSIPGEPTSTIDIAGHGSFVLLSGIGGGLWKKAAGNMSALLKVPITVQYIGFRQDWEDESGAVAPEVLRNAEECEWKLLTVMRSILGFAA
ncbi:FAD binding domain-containing protein [Aspergillus ambiguus]|uniref:FAD binding domain-containing protein n=1 Tax=Aspergillus ambiguus TaxID=176160 RepID=UPI003CCDF138